MWKQLGALLYKDFQFDFRQRFGVGGIFLYVFSSFFIVFLSFRSIGGEAWVTLFWIIILFGSVNAVLKSFTQESERRRLYYYTLVDPVIVILAKVTYNFTVVLLVTLFSLILFTVLTQFPIASPRLFFMATLLGVIGIATNFSLVSGIASHTRNKSTMMMILSLPVVIPLLLPLVRVSRRCLEVVAWSDVRGDLNMLLSIDLLILGLTFLLFPFLWRS